MFRSSCMGELPFRPPESWHGCRITFHFQGFPTFSLSHVMGSSGRMTNVWISCSGIWESYERHMKVVLNRVKTYEGRMSFFPRSPTRLNATEHDLHMTEHDLHTIEHDCHTTFIRLNTTFQLGLNCVLNFCIAKI